MQLLKTFCLFGAAAAAAAVESQRKLIIGGDFVEPNENTDYVAGLRKERDGENFCGGALIAQDVVITAAHCVRGNSHVNWVSLGSKDLNGTANGEQIRVKEIFIHDDFDRQEIHAFDFALLQLEASSSFQPIELASRWMEDIDGFNLFAYGWGRTKHFGRMSPILKVIDLDVMPLEECSRYLAGVHNSMICAKHTEDTRLTTFAGDSGGPLVYVSDDNKPILVGLSTWGIEPHRMSTRRVKKQNIPIGKAKFKPCVFSRITKSASLLRKRCAGCSGDLLEDSNSS